MNKILRYSLVALLAMVMGNVYADDVTDVLTWETMGLDASGNSYKDYADLKFTSPAVYAAQASSGTGQYIQLRSNNNNAGIITTTSGGKLKSVKVTFNSKTTDRSLEIYGSNAAYTAPTDLYDAEKAGTPLGAIAANADTNVLTVEGDFTFVGMRSASGAIYIDKIEVTWAGEGGAEGGTRVWDFTILPTQKVDGTGNLEGNLGDAGVFVEDGGAAWQQVYNKAGLPDGTEFTCADGVVFEPTKGLKWSALENNKMVFYRNYPAAEGSNYGGKHLAFNKAAEVMIPAKAGQVIEMVLASSKSGGTTKKITSQDVVETFDDGGGIKIEFPTAYEYNTYTLTAKVDNPYLAFESTFCVQKITVKDAGASAEGGVVFSWEGGEAGATVTGGTATYMSGPEGTDRVNYKNADYYTLSINGKKGNMGTEASNNGGYIQIDLNQELAADDAIEMTGYINKNEAGKEASIFFQFEKGEGVDDPYIYGDADNIDPTVGGKISTHELKVPADAAGSKNFKMSRNKAGTNVFLTKLVITRGGASGISDVKVVRVADGAIYNLAGQKVGKDYKGIVIMNGRKFMQK